MTAGNVAAGGFKEMSQDKALIVMAKAPRPGLVKTRLCPPLSPEQAAALYACLLADTAAEMARLSRVRRYLFIETAGAPESPGDPAFRPYERHPQVGKDLGDRMARAADTAFRNGAKRVVIVGADCPALSAGTVRQAFSELRDGAAAVFVPTVDGGFCLVGLAAPEAAIFRRIAWSTGTVLSEVARRCRSLGMAYALLPPERDVDVYEDLIALRGWAAARRTPACPRTREWLTAGFASVDDASRGRQARTGSPPPGARPRPAR